MTVPVTQLDAFSVGDQLRTHARVIETGALRRARGARFRRRSPAHAGGQLVLSVVVPASLASRSLVITGLSPEILLWIAVQRGSVPSLTNFIKRVVQNVSRPLLPVIQKGLCSLSLSRCAAHCRDRHCAAERGSGRVLCAGSQPIRRRPELQRVAGDRGPHASGSWLRCQRDRGTQQVSRTGRSRIALRME